MSPEYQALVAKVEAFTSSVAARRARDLACGEGCASCCEAWLSVSDVEAAALRGAIAQLPPETRAELRARGAREQEREARGASQPRCAMLDERGACSVYDARPIVCRTQGHALRYPEGLIPRAAITRKTNNGDVTWCPLNYHRAAPNAEDVLDAERVDQILAVVAERYVRALGLASGTRHALSALAAEGDVLHDRTAHDDEFENA